MSTLRWPVMIWEDQAGLFTGTFVEWIDDDVAAVGGTEEEVRRQLQAYLQWQAKDDPYLGTAELEDPEVTEIVVPVRAEYRGGHAAFPSEQEVRLRITCVHGPVAAEVHMCSMPRLDVSFYYHGARDMRPLVLHYVQTRLDGLTPQQLGQFLPPRSVRVDTLTTRVSRRAGAPEPAAELEALPSCAEALDDKSARRRFTPAWEREDVARDLSRRIDERTNVLLVGAEGSGKSTLVVDAIRRITKSGPTPRFWMTSGARLVAGMRYLGQWQARVEQVIAELGSVDGVLCLENLLDIVRAAGAGAEDGVAAFLQPYLQAGELRMVAETTVEELEACRRMLPGLLDVFEILTVEPLPRASVVTVFDRLAETRTQSSALVIERGVSEQLYRMFARFLPYAAFPGRAARFFARVIDEGVRDGDPIVDSERIVAELVEQTGLPELFLRDEVPLDEADVIAALEAEVIGQGDACRLAANVVSVLKAGLNDPERPVSVLLFSGPTGVGKTQLARALSTFCFGKGRDAERLIRLDMSEYANPGSASRLLLGPEGKPSAFIERVRQQPFVVVLFDEIEKAALEVFDVLLNLLDEGRLTDPWGRVTDFKSAIVIMTSNLGARAPAPVGVDRRPPGQSQRDLMFAFRPEFFNRIDEVVRFAPLGPDAIIAITEKELRALEEREGFARRGLKLSWDPAVVRVLAARGFDVRYGARNLQRTLEDLVVAPTARALLDAEPESGGTITLAVVEGSVVVRLLPPPR